jgi:hypothetical protein
MIPQDVRTADLYACLDKRPGELAPAAGAVVRALRSWASGAMSGICPVRMMAPPLVLDGHGEWIAPAHRFMLALCRSVAAPMRMGPDRDGVLSDTEALLVTAIAALQGSARQQARSALAQLVRADAVGDILHEAMLFACVLQQTGGSFHTHHGHRAGLPGSAGVTR